MEINMLQKELHPWHLLLLQSHVCVSEKWINEELFDVYEEVATAPLCDLNEFDYNILINFGILKEFIMQVACCPDCSSRNVEFVDNIVLRMGYAHKLKFSCYDCAYEHDYYTPKMYLCIGQSMWQNI